MNSGFQVDTTWLDALETTLKTEPQALCELFAGHALAAAQEAIPAPGRSGGFATGALRDSGYVISPRISGYDAAIAKARSATGTRIVKRAQIEPPFGGEYSRGSGAQFSGQFWAVFDFPLTYAALVQKGFNHASAGRHISGSDFIQAGLGATENEFQQAAQQLLYDALRKAKHG